MRLLIVAFTTLALSACDSGAVPSPSERQEQIELAEPVDPNQIKLNGDGLVAGAEAFYFAAGRWEVEASLIEILSDPINRQSNDECGAGPMEFTQFPSGLTVNFQGGRLVGWLLDEDAENISVIGDVTVGTERAEVEAHPDLNAIADSTLGEEFILSGAVAGFIEDDKVSKLYAGVQCFFR